MWRRFLRPEPARFAGIRCCDSCLSIFEYLASKRLRKNRRVRLAKANARLRGRVAARGANPLRWLTHENGGRIRGHGIAARHGFARGARAWREARAGRRRRTEQEKTVAGSGSIARNLGVDAAAARPAGDRPGAHGHQPRFRPGASLHDEISGRQRDDPPPDAAVDAAGGRRASRDDSAGRDFLHADANAFESGAADDHRAAQEGAGARRAPAGRVLRREQNRARSSRAS